jgi:nicotinamide phosphoribosyltransferase
MTDFVHDFNEDDSFLFLSDSYKYTHWPQYEKGTTKVRAYLEPRGGPFPAALMKGLQRSLKKVFCRPITMQDVNEAEDMCRAHFGRDLFNRAGWEYIINKKGGYLPLEIRAVAEGSIVPVSNALIYVENTDPNCWWLTNFAETVLVQQWYPITVATLSRHCRRIIREFLEQTGGLDGLDYKLHDFGFRGATCVEGAKIGGMAHLVNFRGTDTFAALRDAKRYYHEPMAGHSIPASEHSTITSWGKTREYEAFKNMLTQYPDGLVACVSDSYDLMKACDAWGSDPLKSMVMARPGTLVVRPDSGEPVATVLATIERLATHFPPTVNQQGYRELPPQIRMIQGDGVNPDSIRQILQTLKDNGWSAANLAFGMGGALLQKLDRDTMKFAFKCCSTVVNGEDRDVFKDPVTDHGKRSKAGKLKLIEWPHGTRRTVREEEAPETQNLLLPVFRNGQLLIDYKFSDIRTRAEAEEATYWKEA